MNTIYNFVLFLTNPVHLLKVFNLDAFESFVNE